MISVLTLWFTQCSKALVVSEVMYHPVEEGGISDGNETLEFIELYNNRAVFEDLSGFAFTNAIRYIFEPGTILDAKEYLVVARDPNAFRLQYPEVPENKIFGPFDVNSNGTGRTSLNNNGERIELSACEDANVCEIILSFRYNDGRPWPTSADGTGHSLILLKQGGDPEEASTWAPSTFIGGTPGGPDEVQVGPEDPTLLTLVDLGHPGRYFKGTEEPSPGTLGEATTDWTEIVFNEDPNTTSWLDGPTGYGYSSDSAELQWVRTQLNDMSGSYISVYARLSFTLTSEQIASFTQLRAEVHYDDGYVLYLNGNRVADSGDIAGTPPPFNQSGGSASDFAAANVDLTGWMNQLVAGTNVLAIQAHNAALSGSSDCIGSPILRAVIEEPGTSDDPHARLVINEFLANSDADPNLDWIELYNPGPIAVDLNNVYLSDARFELLKYKIPDGIVLQPGEFWAVSEGSPPAGLGFALSHAGETIYLTAATTDTVPEPLRVLDVVRYGPVRPDVTLGRYPDGDNFIGELTSLTYGAKNSKPFIHDVVINEIMYHHGIRDNQYEYIELYNQGPTTVNMFGWKFTDGIRYDFPPGTGILPYSYLVVAKDPNSLIDVYSNLVRGQNLFGPYSGELDDHSERIRLSYPFIDPDTYDVNMITVDEVTYYDGGRWPKWADGQGASMELRDPRSNNNTPDAWADSDESGKAEWQRLTFGIYDFETQYTHDTVTVFELMLLNRGEVLIDDLELIINSTSCLTNGDFESGLPTCSSTATDCWRTLGNHVQSHVTMAVDHTGYPSNVLHLIATGHGDPGANRINQKFDATGITANNVSMSCWAKWVRGSRYLLLRTTRERSPVQPPRPAHAFELNMPLNLGTPGMQNTAFISNRGPEILKVQHAPVLPVDNETIVVTAQVTDIDDVNSVMLYYRSEGTSTFTSTSMVDDGSGDDLIDGDSIYTAIIPGASAGTMRAFYIVALDKGMESTRFPTELDPTADVPNRTCLVRVGDSMLTSHFANYRVWMSNDVLSTFTSRPNLSNELMDCTFVYNDTEVFYNVRIRFRGSPFIRSGCCRDPRSRYAYRIDFNPDQKFGGRDEINLDNTEGGNRGPLQERASYWFYKKMGLQHSKQEYVRVIINGNSNFIYEDVQKIDGDYTDKWFKKDDNGYIHKIDDYFEYTADGTGFANLDEGLKSDSSHPRLIETYRWGFEKRSHRENDNWEHLLDFAEAMNTSPSSPDYEATIESVVDANHFARVLALRHAVGDWDSYGYNRGKNNYFYYAPKRSKWYLLPWDIDFTLGSGNGPTTNLFSVNSGQFPEVYQFMHYPTYELKYLKAFAELVHGPWETSYGTANPPTKFDLFLDDAANALITDGLGDGRRDEIKAFVRDRRAYILTQIPTLIFEITTNSGDDFCTSSSPVTIKGTAPLEVVGISVNGTTLPAGFSGNNVFEVDVPVPLGPNSLTLQGLDISGDPVSGATDSITVTRVLPYVITSVIPNIVCNNNSTGELRILGSGFVQGSSPPVGLTSASEEIGFDALYVQNDLSFDRIDAATLLLDDPDRGIGDPVYAVHTVINLFQTGSEGVFTPSDQFAAPYNSGDPANFAVRFTGYIYAPSPGIRYFGVNSDDGFVLSIDDQLVGEYANARGPATTDVLQNRTAGTMTFDFPVAGSYFLVLDFFENGGGEEIEFFQTNSTGGEQRLINVDAELVVYRDDVTRIDATNVTVANENTITCEVDIDIDDPNTWNLVLTPQCGSQLKVEGAVLTVSCQSNFNNDLQINFLDYAELADIWDQPCSVIDWCNGLDLDFSERIDMGDLAIVADEWLLGTYQ
jgi:hypothetical protein